MDVPIFRIDPNRMHAPPEELFGVVVQHVMQPESHRKEQRCLQQFEEPDQNQYAGGLGFGFCHGSVADCIAFAVVQ
jgi:hypothetical protein